jgi:phage host-nuclease inhibitor protein Gam
MDVTVATPPKVFNGEEKQKLQQLIREGIQVMREVDSLREGLGDTVKALAEEFSVKPAVLKKAIRTAYKNDWDRTETDHVQLENILIATGMR